MNGNAKIAPTPPPPPAAAAAADLFVAYATMSVSVCPFVCDRSALAHRFQIPIPIYRALRSRCMRARALNYL